MALELLLTNKGAEVSYHRIVAVEQSAICNHSVVKLAGYANQQARQADQSSYLMMTSFTFPVLDATRADLYALIVTPSPKEQTLVAAVYDEAGEIVTPAEVVTVESNVWAEAESV